MARIRTIKPEFFTSITIAALRYEARLTFVGLWTHVDDSGRCIDDVRLIRAALWPLDDRTFGDVDKDLDDLAEAGLIRRYSVGGRRYLQVSSWAEHQRISKPTRSKLPPPPLPEGSGNSPGGLPEDSRSVPRQLPDDSAGERKGKEQGKEGKGETLARGHMRDSPESHTSQAEQTHRRDVGGLITPLPDEDELPYAQRPRKVPCRDHGAPDDRQCVGCKSEHGDMAYFARKRVLGDG